MNGPSTAADRPNAAIELAVNVRCRKSEISSMGAGETLWSATNATSSKTVHASKATIPFWVKCPRFELVVVRTRPITRMAMAAVNSVNPLQLGGLGRTLAPVPAQVAEGGPVGAGSSAPDMAMAGSLMQIAPM